MPSITKAATIAASRAPIAVAGSILTARPLRKTTTKQAKQVEAMIYYVTQTDKCRSVTLLEYFGHKASKARFMAMLEEKKPVKVEEKEIKIKAKHGEADTIGK